MELFDKIQAAQAFITSRVSSKPKIGIGLGTGLGALADEVEITHTIDFKDIPHFPEPTVIGHNGKMLFGSIAGVEVVMLAGRLHYYEGHSMEEITFPIRVLSSLGITQLILSNVAGGLQSDLLPGHLVFLKDHINLQGENPLRGKNDDRLGLRFPDMLKTYRRDINQKAIKVCKKLQIPAREGVYVALSGPSLETPAEYNFLHIIGGDVVGMSTVPEVIVARHMKIDVFAISIVSNKCYPIEEISETTVEEVIAVAEKASAQLVDMIKNLLPQLD